MRSPLTVALSFALLLPTPRYAHALSGQEALERATEELEAVERRLPALRTDVARAMSAQLSAIELIAEGELAQKAAEYPRAIDILSVVMELHAQQRVDTTAHANAIKLLADSYFADGQLLSAARCYQEIVENSGNADYARYAGQSLSRLVDVAHRTGHTEQLEFVFSHMNTVSSGADASGGLAVAKAKAHFTKHQYAAALDALKAVGPQAEYAHQAEYLRGVIALRQLPPAAPEGNAPRFGTVIERFQQITKMPADSPAHRDVIDLAWMAIARLLSESQEYLAAADAYGHIQRQSSQFNTMLYELAWVHIHVGDYQRAQRALEVLAIAAPETLEIADGPLLRADLMLRSGQFENALKLYRSVRGRFDPIRAQVDAMLTRTTEPGIYYDRLVEEQTTQIAGEKLPGIVTRWVREAAEADRVFAIIDEMGRARALINRSERMANRLSSVLGSTTRAQAFPELKQRSEDVLGLINQLALARLDLVNGLDEEADNVASGLVPVQQERGTLVARLRSLPATEADFNRRGESARQGWRAVSQELQRLELESEQMSGIVSGLRRVLRDAESYGVTTDPASRARFELEVEANERDIKVFRKQITEYRDAIEAGRVQVGFGDQEFQEDARVRERFRTLVTHEFALSSQGAAGEDAQDYAREVQPLLTKITQTESQLAELAARLDAEVAHQARDLSALVSAERENIGRAVQQLDVLDGEAKGLVGEVALRSFVHVRDRLKGIVLKADVGIVQQAWELRVEQAARVRDLQRARAEEEQELNDELREVLDDSGAL